MNQLDMRLGEISRVVVHEHDMESLDTDVKLEGAIARAVETEVYSMGDWDLLQAAMANPGVIMRYPVNEAGPMTPEYALRQTFQNYFTEQVLERLSYLGDAYIPHSLSPMKDRDHGV